MKKFKINTFKRASLCYHFEEQTYKQLQQKNIRVFIPKFSYCTDNAAMIAITGYYHLKTNQPLEATMSPNARLKL